MVINMSNSINSSFTNPSIVNNNPIDDQDADHYTALSHLGKLFKEIKKHETVDCTPSIKSAFSQLNRQDQLLIYEMISSPNTADLQWGEIHVFDDMNIFISAANKAIELKYQRLNDYQKQMVHENIHNIAGKPLTSDNWAEWGRLCAMNNLPRLADAMEEGCSLSPFPITNQMVLKFNEALNRFKTHPLYPLLFQKNIFLNEKAMKECFAISIFKGTCDSQSRELNKLADANPTWSRSQLLMAIQAENVFYQQIIKATKSLVRKFHDGAGNPAEKRQLQSMVECLQTSQTIHTRLTTHKIPPNGDYAKLFNGFMQDLKSKKNDNSFHGKLIIEDIDEGEGKRIGHAIFFQHLKKESIYRFYDNNSGFFEFRNQDGFFEELKDNICKKYFKTNDPLTKVFFSVEADETQFPCHSTLGKVYQAVIQNKDQKEIERVFSLLTRDDQRKIYEKIYQYAGEPTTNDSNSDWGEHHVFDHPEILRTALSYEILQRYQQSAPDEKKRIEAKVASFDENYMNQYSPSDWGSRYAFRNLPRLADAML